MMKIEPSILPSLAWFALIVRAAVFPEQPLKWVLRGPHCPRI